MANVLNNPTHVAKIGYNGFDMSQLVKFSSSVGQLLPIYYDVLSPGDKVRCSTELKTRTQPLDSAAMMHVTEHLDWFFVPMQQIFKPFESYYYGIQDFDTDFYDSNFTPATNHFPIFNVNELLRNSLTQNNFDAFGISNYANTLRLCDCLGYPVKKFIRGDDDGDAVNLNVSTFPIFALAYQKIYSDYFRLSDRETNNPQLYNVDSLAQVGYIPNSRAAGIFTLRYRPWKRDFLTNIFVSPLMGSNGVGSLNGATFNNEVNQWLTSLGFVDTGLAADDGDLGIDREFPSSVLFNPSSDDSGSFNLTNSSFSPANIRTMFAVEKLLEITRRAGKHYDKQTLAHFGVDVPTGTSGECFYLGEHTQDLQIGDVIATAQTDDTPLGEIAGKGYSFAKSNDITFEAKTHGVLMCIYSAVPEVDYQNLMLDKLNCLVRPTDWFKPEFDNLGMQPLFQYQSEINSNYTDILGWQYRYSELKTKYNRVWGSLIGSNKNWTTAREGLNGNELSQFLINPKFLNSVMVYAYQNPWYIMNWQSGEKGDDLPLPDGATSAPNVDVTQEIAYSMLYDSDPLLHECYFNVFKSSKMSTYGLFNL